MHLHSEREAARVHHSGRARETAAERAPAAAAATSSEARGGRPKRAAAASETRRRRRFGICARVRLAASDGDDAPALVDAAAAAHGLDGAQQDRLLVALAAAVLG